jgi:hypothetical protein
MIRLLSYLFRSSRHKILADAALGVLGGVLGGVFSVAIIAVITPYNERRTFWKT